MKTRLYVLYSLQLLIVALLTTTPLITNAQDGTGSCAEKLRNAQSLFDRGQVEQVAGLLKGCLRSGFNREEEIAAFKLLIQTFLFEDKLAQADSAMLEFLKKNPEYELSPTDHSSFVFLFNNFRVRSVIQLSFRLGANLPYVTFIDQHSPLGIPGKSIYNSSVLNLYTSFEAKFRISDKFDLNIETGYSQIKFTNIEDILDYGRTTYNESQSRIEIPIGITWNIKNFGKVTPYLRSGLGPAFTLRASAGAESRPTDYNNPISITGPDVDRQDSRISIDLFVQAGAGVKLKTRGGFFLAEIRTNAGLLNQTVRGGSSTEELIFAYKYEDDDFHINTLNFCLGYTQIFYKPTKRTE
jgi:hypothetical protein